MSRNPLADWPELLAEKEEEIEVLRAQLAKAKEALRPYANEGSRITAKGPCLGDASFHERRRNLLTAFEVYKELERNE